MYKRSAKRLFPLVLMSIILVSSIIVYVCARAEPSESTSTIDTPNTLSPQLIIRLAMITALIALILVMIFYPDKLRARLSVKTSPARASWMEFSYSHIETGESIQVGEWLDEYHGDQRIITFKPSRPLREDESGLMNWLEIHLSEFGKVTSSENGEMKITCLEQIQPDKLLEQVGWVFYTLQMT